MFLCFIFRCSIGNIITTIVIMGGQHDGLLLSSSPPIVYIEAHLHFSWQINSAAAAVAAAAVAVVVSYCDETALV